MKVTITKIDLWKIQNRLQQHYRHITFETPNGLEMKIPISDDFCNKIEKMILENMKDDIKTQIITAIGDKDDKNFYSLDI